MYARIPVVLAFAGAALSQGTNCQLLGTHNLHAPYANIWGYVAPNGKEYALLGATTGTVIIDCSNPSAPVERGFIPWVSSTWKELQSYSHYCYVCTEAAGGFQVIDLANPDAPVLVGITGAAQFNNCHTISVDVGAGRIYCNGTQSGGSPGVPVFDCAANPANPVFLGNAAPRNAGNPQSTYFHDMCVQNGYAYGAMIYNGFLRIMSTTGGLPLPILSSTSTPGVFTHNAWPNAAGTICVTTDEVSGSFAKFWDITNKSAPLPLGQYSPNLGAIVHNAYIIGNIAHVSWYTEGYRALDFTDPMNIVEVASYDTWPGPTGGFNGAWGVFPFLPSGNVFISDISTGLYIVRPLITDMVMTHAALPDTTDEAGPYDVRAVVTTSNTLQSVQLVYSVGGGAPTTVAMTPTGNPNEFGANIPGQEAPVRVAYHVEAQDNIAGRRSPQEGEHMFFVGTLDQVVFDDFETDLGWTHGMVAVQDDWQRGTPTGRSGTSAGVGWSDPAGAFSGANCWGNDLGGTGFNGSYALNGVSNWLQSPSFPTNGRQGLHLRYRRWISLNTGDTGRVLVNGSLVATVPASTRDLSWQWIDHDISAITDSASSIVLRFELITNATTVAGGWNLDDVEVYLETDCAPPVHYGPGTPGTGGIIPVVSLNGDPRLGETPLVEGSSLLGSSLAILAVGFAPTNFPALGIQVLVDTNNGGFFLWTLANGAFGVGGAGAANWALQIPPDPVLDGLDVYTQVGTLDSGSPGGTAAASNGMRFRICSQ
jgi:choice-of-anchor B domain-containing protein